MPLPVLILESVHDFLVDGHLYVELSLDDVADGTERLSSHSDIDFVDKDLVSLFEAFDDCGDGLHRFIDVIDHTLVNAVRRILFLKANNLKAPVGLLLPHHSSYGR